MTISPGWWSADVEPSGTQARQWLAEELAKPDYHDGRPLLSRIVDWIIEQIAELLSRIGGTGPTGPGAPPILVALLVALIIAGLALMLRRVRRERTTVAADGAVLGELSYTPAEFRDRGRAALREGRWDDAVVEFTRALAREAADRTLLSEAPSLTAHEVGTQLAPVFPTHAAAVAAGMDLFDKVRYGRYAATEADATAAAGLDETLRRAKPVLTADATATGSGT